VSEENLDTAFNYLDEDGNGKLSIQEIRKRLG
jgi:Ca2+-binding EF-hand superfamily protein